MWTKFLASFLALLIFIPLDFDGFFHHRVYIKPWINDSVEQNKLDYFFLIIENNFFNEDQLERTMQRSMLAREEEISPVLNIKNHFSTGALSKKIIQTGHYLVGRPYVLGAFPLQSVTMDCASFVQYIYYRNGINIPRLAIDQSKIGIPVKKEDLQEGDIVFFSDIDGNLCHSALYVGNDTLLHTFNHIGVAYSNINSRWWSSHYLFARRILDE